MSRTTSIAFLTQEIADAASLAEAYGIELQVNLSELTVLATIVARDGEKYIVKFTFEGYRTLPPLVQFVHPVTGEIDTNNSYPNTANDSFFHPAGPSICAPFNLGAYEKIHREWVRADWTLVKIEGADWSRAQTFKGMLEAIWGRIYGSSYQGRKQ